MKYLLPCSCGESTPIDISQAGQTLPCVCGKVLEVPALRLIRQLAPAAVSPAQKTRPRRSWTLTQRLLFATGFAVFVIGLATAAFFQWIRTGLDTQEQPWDNLAQATRDIDNMSIDATWELWKIVRAEEIGPYNPPTFIMVQQISAHWLKTVFAALVAAGVGFVILLSAFVFGRRSGPRP